MKIPHEKSFFQQRRRWRIGLIAAFLAFNLGSLPARADYTTTVNPAVNWGTWEGWGSSLAWWAKIFGNRDDLADIVYTTKFTSLNGQMIPGLGLNIVRYNAGASSLNSVNGIRMQVSPNIISSRQIEGYWTDWVSSDPTSRSWNWAADNNQRAMLLKAKSRGANIFELFSNSPMWWMCINHNPSGSDSGSADNLQPFNVRNHAVYLATIAKFAKDNWGLLFNTVEAFNEPSANWWKSTGGQEGCHFSVGLQSTVIGLLRTELDSRGLHNTLISASDENTYDRALTTWSRLTPIAISNVAQVNVHGYQHEGGRRDLLASAVAGKRLWNSEYGDSDGSGMRMAADLNLDLRSLHPTAWCYWQPLDGGGWGLIQADLQASKIGAVNPKLYVLAQYSRHIRQGMKIIDGGEANTVAAYNASTRTLVLVTTNGGSDQKITFDLSRISSANGPITRWATDTGNGEKYGIHMDTGIINRRLSVSFAANSVQTLEIQNVNL